MCIRDWPYGPVGVPCMANTPGANRPWAAEPAAAPRRCHCPGRRRLWDIRICGCSTANPTLDDLSLTAARAQKVLGSFRLRPGRRRKIRWEASSWDRRAHPDLADGAAVEGWVVTCQNPARRAERLFSFTTLDLKPQRILALYGWRWKIETDLRSLKRTVDLHRVTSKSQAMVERKSRWRSVPTTSCGQCSTCPPRRPDGHRAS